MSRDLLVVLDRDRPGTLRAQLEAALRQAVRSGRMRTGEALPSTRSLAADLGVSRGLVVEAYEQLVAEGYLSALHGSRTIVAEVAQPPGSASESTAPAPAPIYDFAPGAPDTTLLLLGRWPHHMRRAFTMLGAAGWQYGDPAGFAPLRRALADYLARVRGVDATPDRILICSGFAGAVSLLARLLAEGGHERIALENPGSPDVHPIVRHAGLKPVAVPVDAHGIAAEAVVRSAVRAVLVTPAHQFPLGGVLRAERRAALVGWARDVSGVIIEDDYDAEYRYDRAPIGATQGLAPAHVVYAGSLSKTLAPALRLGWLVLPRGMVGAAVELRRQSDLGNPTLPQATLALMLESGDYDRHLRRARRIYRARRDRLVRTLHATRLGITISGAAAGLHLVASLPRPHTEAEILEAARAQRVGLYGLSRFRVDPRPDDEQALVIGYGGFDERRFALGLRSLRAAISACSRLA